ncbi:signal peptidase I [Streptococcus sp. zg-JUN1979]|uniref:signal peptidase I n=1 Tax=Streptococcus sp. zg-JUN1979 TaxID=3391450 RepID=UPI0039A7798D
MRDNKTRLRTKKATVWSDLAHLFGKMALVGLLLALIYYFLFGLVRYGDNSMTPAIKNGDLVLYYRLDKQYQVGELAAYTYQDRLVIGRVVATGGDKVDITDKGLVINGALQQEDELIGETLPYEKGITFPLTVPKNHIFVLGDNRNQATDSRIFGTIALEDTDGKVVMFLRRRGF